MKTYHKLLIIIFIITVSVLSVKAYRDYMQVAEVKHTVILRESSSLAQFIIAFRKTYQNIFLQPHVGLTEKTLPFLPVLTTGDIAQEYLKSGSDKKVIRTVSNNPVNPINKANAQEMRAITYFNTNRSQEFYLEEEKDGKYFYAVPVFTAPMCLQCHNGEESRPSLMSGYAGGGSGYKEGDLRGIISISGDNEELVKKLNDEYKQNMIIYGLIGVFLLWILSYLFKGFFAKDEYHLSALQKEVNEQTKAIQEKNKEIVFQLFHDPLTNLPNRNKLIQELKEKKYDVLLLVNVDAFKEINDFYGQDVGDEVLISFASFLELFANEYGYVPFKLHADEYALTCKDKEVFEVRQEVERLIESVKKFVVFTEDDHDIDVTATVGVAVNTKHILSCADMALKKAKKERQSLLIYDNSMEIKEEYEKNIEWAKKLKKAIKDDQIVAYYQPIQRLRDKSITKYEALIRIIDEQGTIIYPGSFLEISKKTKLYHQLTRMMIELTFKRFEQTELSFSVNLSILDMLHQETVDFIFERLKNYPNPKQITFEILESEGIENYDKVYKFVKKVKAFGCRIAIDDFGSGYSNFEHILNLHVDIIKIDASLIRTIDRNQNARIIVETIVSFAKALNIETCAEFVHSQEVYAVLQEVGVTYVQGYYIGEPGPNL